MAHDAKEMMRSLLPLGVDIAGLAMDTAVAAYLLDPSTDQYRLSDLAARFLGVTVDDGTGAKGQGSFVLDEPSDADRRATTAWARRICGRSGWPRFWPGCDPRWPTPWPRWGRTRLYADIEQPLVRVLARMEVVGIPVDRDVLRSIAAGLAEECALPGAHHPGPGRRAVQGQLGAPAPHRALREIGPHPGAQDQDRVLDRRPHPRAPARPAPDHRGPAALPRGGEAPVHLRGEPGRRGGRRRPHPRHLPPDRGPHRAAVVGPAQPSQHPGPHRGGPPVPRGVRALAGPAPAGGRLRPGGAAGHRPSVRGPRPHRGLRRRRGHPPLGGLPGVRRRAGPR